MLREIGREKAKRNFLSISKVKNDGRNSHKSKTRINGAMTANKKATKSGIPKV